jgi:hypothetical protein
MIQAMEKATRGHMKVYKSFKLVKKEQELLFVFELEPSSSREQLLCKLSGRGMVWIPKIKIMKREQGEGTDR